MQTQLFVKQTKTMPQSCQPPEWCRKGTFDLTENVNNRSLKKVAVC